jgi:hypothetical protein
LINYDAAMFYARLLIRRIFGGPLPPVPEFDADRANPDQGLQAAKPQIRGGDWQAAKKVMADAGDDHELRGRRLQALSGLAIKDDGWLRVWLHTDPSDATALMIQAAVLQSEASEARGAASAKNTTPEQFAAFHELSQAAGQVGRRAMQLAAPGDPLPWVDLLNSMFGDRQARAHFDEVFAEGRRRDPYNFDLHLAAVSLRCQKWFGSHEQMFGIARQVAAAAPPGANVLLMPLFAHIEYAMREFGWDERSDEQLNRCRAYFQRPDVQQEVDQAIARWRAGTPNPARGVTCRNWVALYYSLARRRPEAKAVFDELGQYVVAAAAWAYFYSDEEYGYLTNWWWANGVH